MPSDYINSNDYNLDAINQACALKEADFSEHVILIYKDILSFREMYCCFCKEVFQDKLDQDQHIRNQPNEMVILMPFYETADQVRHALREKGIKVAKYENNGLLLITDSAYTYFGSDIDILALVKILSKKTENQELDGFTIIADMGAFYHFGKLDELKCHEQSLPLKFEFGNFKGICCYHIKDFERLDEQSKETILSHHFRVLQQSIE